MFGFYPDALKQQYESWLKQMQTMPGMQGQNMGTNPFAAFGVSGQSPFAAFGSNPGAAFAPFSNYGQSLGMLQQAVDSLRQFASSSGFQGAPWMNQFQGFSPAGSHAPGLENSPFANVAGNSPFGFSTNALGNKFVRIQQIAAQMYKLLASATKPESVRGELVELSRQLTDTLVEEVNNLTGNFLTMQFINNMRAFLAFQEKTLKEQMVQASMTPWRSDFECYQNTCTLWQKVCESVLNMLDVYQQFTEVFSERFADTFVDRINEENFTPQSVEQIVDLFVELYEVEFGKLLRSDNFSKTYGDMVNCLMAARLDQQQYIDKTVESLGLPSKREMDSSHKRVHRHNKELRSIKQHLGKMQQAVEQIETLVDEVSKTNAQVNKLQTGFVDHSKQLTGQTELLDTLVKKTDEVQTLQTRLEDCGKQMDNQQDKIDQLVGLVDKLADAVASKMPAVSQSESAKSASATEQKTTAPQPTIKKTAGNKVANHVVTPKDSALDSTQTKPKSE